MSFQANIDTYKLTQLPRLCTLNMDNYIIFSHYFSKEKQKTRTQKMYILLILAQMFF